MGDDRFETNFFNTYAYIIQELDMFIDLSSFTFQEKDIEIIITINYVILAFIVIILFITLLKFLIIFIFFVLITIYRSMIKLFHYTIKTKCGCNTMAILKNSLIYFKRLVKKLYT